MRSRILRSVSFLPHPIPRMITRSIMSRISVSAGRRRPIGNSTEVANIRQGSICKLRDMSAVDRTSSIEPRCGSCSVCPGSLILFKVSLPVSRRGHYLWAE